MLIQIYFGTTKSAFAEDESGTVLSWQKPSSENLCEFARRLTDTYSNSSLEFYKYDKDLKDYFEVMNFDLCQDAKKCEACLTEAQMAIAD